MNYRPVKKKKVLPSLHCWSSSVDVKILYNMIEMSCRVEIFISVKERGAVWVQVLSVQPDLCGSGAKNGDKNVAAIIIIITASTASSEAIYSRSPKTRFHSDAFRVKLIPFWAHYDIKQAHQIGAAASLLYRDYIGIIYNIWRYKGQAAVSKMAPVSSHILVRGYFPPSSFKLISVFLATNCLWVSKVSKAQFTPDDWFG